MRGVPGDRHPYRDQLSPDKRYMVQRRRGVARARLESPDGPPNGLQDADRRPRPVSHVRRPRQSLHRNRHFGYPSGARTTKIEILGQMQEIDRLRV